MPFTKKPESPTENFDIEFANKIFGKNKTKIE